MKDNISNLKYFNTKEYEKQFIEDSKKDGGFVEIYTERFNMEDMLNEKPIMPLVHISSVNPFTAGVLLHSMKLAMKKLEEKPEVKEIAKFLEFATKEAGEIDLGGNTHE